jgi:hypothetical protein
MLKATPKNAAAIIGKIVKSYFSFGINNQDSQNMAPLTRNKIKP